MNSLYRSVSIYSRHYFLLPPCSPSTNIMSSHSKKAFSPGDRRSPTPMNHTTSVVSFSSKSNDYDEKFPPLGASTKKSGNGSGRSEVCFASTNPSTPCKSSQSHNPESGKDALSSQRDQSLIRKKDLHSETNTPVVGKIEVDLGSTNTSTPSNRSQSPCKNWDSMRRPVLPLPHVIYAPVDRSNDTNVTDQFIKEEANMQNVEVGNGTSSKDKRKALRQSIHDLASSTPCKRWIPKDDSYPKRNQMDSGFKNNDQFPKKRQSQDWRNHKDVSYSKKNQRDSGFKNGDQVPKRRQSFDICYSFRKRNNTSIKNLSLEEEEEETIEVSNKHKVLRQGMVLLKHYLTHKVQVEIVKTCRELGRKPSGFYQPGYTDGAKLRLQMMCLGRNWDPQTKYDNQNTKTDQIPERFSELVTQAIKEAQALTVLPSMKSSSPDICIVNFYTESGRLGLHQDRDESRESMRLGIPIVSFSIGDSAEFLYGEERDVEKAEQVKLESGDVLIFGGESRMVFHGVKSIIPKSAPKCLLDESKLRRGRLNLTFRQF